MKQLKQIFLVLALLLLVNVGWGQISESFESGLPTSYNPTLTGYVLGSGTWQIQDVISGTTGVQSGTKSAQLKNATGSQIITPTLTGGVGTISFYVTASTTSGAYQVNLSTDNGANWSAATGSPFTISTTKTLKTIVVNNANVNKIQIYRTGATIYIDDFSASVYALTPPTLSPDATSNNVDNNIDITFTDNATWRAAITAVKIGGSALTVTTDYVITSGNIQLKPSGLNTLLTTSGSKTVTVEATGYTTASVTQQIDAGAPTKLGIKTQPTAPATNGAVLAVQPAVYIQDQYGNTTTSTASVTASVGAGSWTLGGTTSVNGVSGTVTYSGLTATSLASVTGATISFTSSGLTGVTSGTFNIPAPVLDYFTINSFNTPVTEDFNTLGSNGTATLPTGWKINQSTDFFTGTTATTIAYGTSGTGVVTGTSSGGAINWANGVTASSTDRSIGFLSTGSYTSPRNIFARVKNNTGSTINTLTITYDIEKYRSGSRSWDINFFVSTDGLNWTAETSGDQNYPADANNTVIYDPPTSNSKSVTINGLSISNGSSYYLRWAYTGNGGSTNAQGLGIDNFSIFALSAPTLTTTAISSITSSSASTGGNITSDGGATVTARGICWSTNVDPTIADSKTTDGTGTGTFTSSMTGLTSGTTYYVRSYATNSVGTSYGDNMVFTTLLNPLDIYISHLSADYNLEQDEFIVLFNNSSIPKVLNAYELKYFDAGGNAGATIYDFSAIPVTIPARSHILLATNSSVSVGSVSNKPADKTFLNGLSKSGQLGLREILTPSNFIFAVAWGDIASYIAGMTTSAAWTPSTSGMISLTKNGNTYTYNSSNLSPTNNGDYSFTIAGSIVDIPNSLDAPLPVILSSLNSSVINRNIKLNWTTASETNNSGFEVERVLSSEFRVKSWEKIGYVQGHGTVNTPTNYSFEDKNLQTGKYKYRLKQIDHNGNYEYFELNGEVEIGVPKKYDLSQNYPNPFNPITKINFDLPVDSKVTMLIYDITGREVAKLLNGEFKKAGYHTTDFNASSLSSGVYFYSLSTDAYRMTKKMVVLK